MATKVTNRCRLCTEPYPPDAVNHSIEDSEVRSKLETVFSFKLLNEKSLPTVVCPECLSKVTEWHSYHETVRSNQGQLMNLIATTATTTGEDLYSSELEVVCVKVEIDNEDFNADEVDDYGEADTKEDQSDSNESDEPQLMPQDNELVGGDQSESKGEKEQPVRKKQKREPTKAKRKYTKRSPMEKDKPKDEKRIKMMEEEDKKIREFFTISCESCAETFDTFYRLQLHTRRDHNAQASIKCCNIVMFRKYKIIQHIDLHLNPDRYHCDICKRSYKNRKYLELHNLKNHSDSEKPFKCDKCPQSFNKVFQLNQHRPTHIQAECPICHKMVANANTLRSHMAIMHGDKPKLICETCGEQFRTKLGMERHIKKHQGLNPIERVQCHICQKWFSGNPRNLQNHIRIVHSEKDLSVQCDICQQVYPHERSLYNHKRLVHTEEKFECDFCGKKFKSAGRLKEHRASHTGQPLYSCDVCGMTSNSNANLYTHKKSKHPEEWLEAKKKALQQAYG